MLLQGQVEAIRANLNGSYRDLLAAMVADPALQISLNGPINHRGKPNENLARELLELFSLGEGHFSELDVIEAARALTGYRLDQYRMLVLDPRRHDPGPKTILGRTAAFDGPKLVEWLCHQPATALTITRRLWLEIVGPLPSSAAGGDRQRLAGQEAGVAMAGHHAGNLSGGGGGVAKRHAPGPADHGGEP